MVLVLLEGHVLFHHLLLRRAVRSFVAQHGQHSHDDDDASDGSFVRNARASWI